MSIFVPRRKILRFEELLLFIIIAKTNAVFEAKSCALLLLDKVLDLCRQIPQKKIKEYGLRAR